LPLPKGDKNYQLLNKIEDAELHQLDPQ
jgi:hypothetical protein